jgi:predicted metalloprotease
MKWRRGVGRRWIEDRRGQGTGGLALPVGGGIGGIGLLILLVVLALTGSLGGGGGAPGAGGNEQPAQLDSELEQFVAFVVDDVQQGWAQAFRESGREYEPTKLVLFEQAVSSGCGVASSETGPFYCPLDKKVYLDLGFFRELRDRFGAPGDFAQAYVIAHEFGHHVQNITGIADEVRREQQSNPDQANQLSVRMELQADCLAGVWGFGAAEEGLLEPGDLDEGLRAAAAIGDDRIQRQAGGQVNPETWTHGSSEQRVTWFRRGFDSGDTQACNTFGEAVL